MVIHYQRPITAQTLPVLAEAVYSLRSRLRRRKLTSVLCGVFALAIHTPLMVLILFELLRDYVGPEHVASLERIPYLTQAADLCLRTLPAKLDLARFLPPELLSCLPVNALLCLAAAVLLPLLVSVVITLLILLVYPKKGRNPLARERDPAVILRTLREVVQKMLHSGRRGRLALWPFLSALASFGVCARDIVGSAQAILNIQHPLVTLLLAVVVFSLLQLLAAAVDQMIERSCRLDTQFDATRLMADLNACPLDGFITIQTNT